MAELDLIAHIYAEGDVPDGALVGEPTRQLPAFYDQLNLPLADTSITQSFTGPADLHGVATIAAYDDRALLSNAYQVLKAAMGPGSTDYGMGDMGMYAAGLDDEGRPARLLFLRCRTVVFLEGGGSHPANSATIITWAARIDMRLQRFRTMPGMC
ncbi:MAG TPA: hypothetical protein VD886_10905 [Herpetosiphonaceae bacterium]|nr:hypothetical protein [Herpetosiphonaceae bacterium]